jgi:hypothetical protein
VFCVEEVNVHVELAELPDESRTLVGLHETVRPVEGLTDSARFTLPEKFPKLVRLMVDDPLEPARKLTMDGLAAMLNPDDATTLTLMATEWDREPLVPVIVTVYVPTVLELRVRVEVPEPPDTRATLIGLREAVVPEGETDAARLTVPAKPFRLVRVMVDCEEEPEVIVRLVGAETVKSVTLTVTWTDWDADPLVANTVTVYVPLVEELAVSVDVPVPPLVKVMLEGLMELVKPEGETLVERETVPAKPLRLVRVIVEVAELPDWAVRLVGLAEMLKLDGLGGRRLVNLIVEGEEVPVANNRSIVGLVPVGLRLSTWSVVAESRRMTVGFQTPPAGNRTYPRGPLPPSVLTFMKKR